MLPCWWSSSLPEQGSSAGSLMKKERPPDDYLENGLYSFLACGMIGVSLLPGTSKETSAPWRLLRGNHESERNDMKPLRLALLGFGTVGQWLAQALQAQHAWLQQEYGLAVTISSVATARSGLIYRGDGLDIPTLLHLAATRQPLGAHPEVTHWTNILEGLQATGGDVLVEATGATLRNGEPGLSYIRTALARACMSSPRVKVLLPWRDEIYLRWHEHRGSSCGWSQP